VTLADSALDLARSGWPVLPLHGKVPCTLHGLRDASMDAEQVHQWWKRYPGANIGARMPESLFVVDLDPRAGAWESLARLEDEHDRLPVTLTVRTGGADRGEHRYYLRPPGPLAMAKLGAGIDLRLPGRHYCVMPPSIHPASRLTYEWIDAAVRPALPPAWLVAMLRPPPRAVPTNRPPIRGEGERPGDVLAAAITWRDLLEPHGWTFAGSRGDVSYWRRPGKVGGTISATTNALATDRLHIFSSNAEPLKPDESYSKFGAFALLEHAGDFSAAARALRREVVSA
jgi:hypothetical protein